MITSRRAFLVFFSTVERQKTTPRQFTWGLPLPTPSLLYSSPSKSHSNSSLHIASSSLDRTMLESTFPPSNPLRPSSFLPVLILLAVTLLSSTAADHHIPSAYSSAALSEWRPAHASYYAAADPRDSVGGACGYGDLGRVGYGMATAGLSEALFEKGAACGGCYEVRCVEELRWCLPGTSIVVTATNFCAPNYGLPAEAGGICNPPNHHFVLPIAAFEKVALWRAGTMPIQYRRIKCTREGGVRFTIDGRRYFLTVLISNVAGAGDVTEVKIKGSSTGWLPMGRNWGQNWHISADLRGQPLSFEVTTSDAVTLTSYNVAPRDWSDGRTYTGKQFPF